MEQLTQFQRDVLYVVGRLGKPSGQDIWAELEDCYETEINNGGLYPNLDSLVELGLITKGKTNERTNHYAVSDAGKREIVARRQCEDSLLDVGTSMLNSTHLMYEGLGVRLAAAVSRDSAH